MGYLVLYFVLTQSVLCITIYLYSVILITGITEYCWYSRSENSKKRGINLENITEMLKGVLEGCVLEIISRGETYGYEITQQLRELGFTDVVEGTVYTITMRLEKYNLVDIEKKRSTMGPPRKFYTLNAAGQEHLEVFWRKWEFVSSKINELKQNQNEKEQ